MVNGLEKLLEKRLPLIEMGMLLERAERLVGGVVPEKEEEPVAVMGEVKNGLPLLLPLLLFPLWLLEKVVGEVARWKDWDMDPRLGIETEGAAEFAIEDAALSRTLSIDEVDFDLWC